MTESAHPEALLRRYLLQVREMYGEGVYVEPVQSVSLREFEADICHCQRCPLGGTRTRFVFGVGDPHADLVLVGEAPGREEDLQGEPFVGKAGGLLNRILAAIHLSRDQVYICNVLKCRPPKNRTPASQEVDTCFPYLERQIDMIRPRLIVTLGATAANVLLPVKDSLVRLRSKMWKWKSYDVVVTYHPAALLRNPRLKRPAWEDFQWIERLIRGE
ncbi:MAG: uracil-DNA glycosylase [Candidatus Neomarinimicrobiota bacterium]